LHHIVKQIVTMFDKQKVTGFTCGIAAIVAVGFCSLFTSVRMVTTFVGGFFYARSFSSLYGGLSGGASARCFLGSSLQTPFNLPPVFCSSDGRNNYQGASL